MFNNQNYNNGENNEGVYLNDNRLQRVGLYMSDNFDQSSNDTIDLTEDDCSQNENVQSHLVQTRIVPVRPFVTQKPTRMLSNGFNSIKIISNNDIGQNLIEQNVNVDGTHRTVFLMNDNMKMLARGKCLLQSGGRQKVDSDEYHAVIVHEPETKIPRPPNAFMIFANEWRKKVAHKFNNESNKDISVRLGHMWRNLDKSRKEEYFVMARKADAEHKMKYPDYVYNPKEARLRKALRDSWKDKGRRTPNGQFRSIVGKSPANWSGSQINQSRTILPKSSLSDMTFSMAADGYSMMETPAWSNSWYSYRHNPVPYIVPQFSESYNGDSNDNYSDRLYHQQMNVQDAGVRTNVMGSSHSPFTDHNEPVENDKGPLSQLQELTNVFSSATACTRNADNEIKQEIPTAENDIKYSQVIPKAEVESTAFNNDSDSGYVTDHPNAKEAPGENDYNKNVSKTGVSDILMTENNGESFMESFESNGQSNYINVDDVFLDCNFLGGEKNFGGSSSSNGGGGGSSGGGGGGAGGGGGGRGGGGGNLEAGDAQGKNVLPGFQQAFGSTEIGRFSRNDFFTNPPPEAPDKVSTDNQLESSNEGVQQSLRKTRTKSVRKPRKVKNSSKKTDDSDEKRTTTTHNNLPDDYFCERQNGCVKKGRRALNVDKSDMYNRHESVMSEQSPYMPPFGYSPSMTSYGNQSMPPYREDSQPPSPYPTPRNQPYQGVDLPYGNQYLRPDPIFPHAYDNYQHRYGYSEYPENHYPYMRNNYTPNYSNYEYPYLRPFGFHLDYGESWSNSGSNWSGQSWVPGQQPPYNSWPTPNMIPFMRDECHGDKYLVQILCLTRSVCGTSLSGGGMLGVVCKPNRPKPRKQLKQEPLDHPWNPIPNPSNYSTGTNDVDYFSEFCDMEEGLLDTHAMLNDPILINPEDAPKKSLAQKIRTERIHKKSIPSSGLANTSFKGDEFLDVLSTVGDAMDDFNMDKLLKEDSDKFNINHRRE